MLWSSQLQFRASMDNLSTVQQQQQMTANQPPRPPVVPYDLMFPFLIPHLHPDKAAELQFLFAKYKVCVCVCFSLLLFFLLECFSPYY